MHEFDTPGAGDVFYYSSSMDSDLSPSLSANLISEVTVECHAWRA